MTEPMNPAEIAAMVANLRSEEAPASRNSVADALDKLFRQLSITMVERDYDRRQTAQLQTVVDRLNNELAAMTEAHAAAVARVERLIEAGLACCDGTPNPDLPRFELALSFIESTHQARLAADVVLQKRLAEGTPT